MRLGVFFSRCDGVVGTSLELEPLAEAYRKHEAVRIFDSFYEPEDFRAILDTVEQHRLEALVLAGDSPLTYRDMRNGEYLYRCLENLGINRNRVEPINLKHIVAMPHQARQEELQSKAKLLIDVGIEKVRQSQVISAVEISPRRTVAIIGANISSIAAAQHLLDEGYKVYLVHSRSGIEFPAEHQAYIRPTWVYVTRHPKFVCYHDAAVSDFFGFTGDYTLVIEAQGELTELPVGAVILSLGENENQIKTAQYLFHIDLKKDGTLAARDEISARSLTQDRGVFIINLGAVKSNDITECFSAADAAAVMVINLLSRNEIRHRVTVSQVVKGFCSGCGACVKTCVFHAVTLQGDPPVSVIDPRRCRGCGNCVTVCPSDARDLIICPSTYLFRAVDILSGFQPTLMMPRVLLIVCDGCGYRCLDQAGSAGHTWPVGVMPLGVVCGGQVDMRLLMYALVKGFEGVALLICGEGCCHNIIGNVELERRINLFKEIMVSRNLDPRRISVLPTCSRDGEECVISINQFYGEIYNLTK